jgi:hypothetical protein
MEVIVMRTSVNDSFKGIPSPFAYCPHHWAANRAGHFQSRYSQSTVSLAGGGQPLPRYWTEEPKPGDGVEKTSLA